MAASTYTFYNGSIDGQMEPPETTLWENGLRVLRNIVDCSKQTLDAGEGDVGQVLAIPAGTTVLSAWGRIITAETANGTIDLGWGGNPDEWGDALAVDAAAGSIVGAINDFVPVYFSTADTVDITATTDTADVDIDGLKIEVCALCLKSLDSY